MSMGLDALGCLSALGGLGGGAKGENTISKVGRPAEQVRVIDYFQSAGGLMGLNDQGFDQLLQQRIQPLQIFNMAVEKLGVDPSQVQLVKPIFLDGYHFDPNDDGVILAKTGRDGVTRCSKYELSAILFGQEQLYMYSYCFDTATYEVEEKTAEYFYSDVESVSVDTYDTEVRYRAAGCMAKPTLGTSRFLIVSLQTAGDCFVTAVRPENISAINGLRNLVREKKQ